MAKSKTKSSKKPTKTDKKAHRAPAPGEDAPASLFDYLAEPGSPGIDAHEAAAEPPRENEKNSQSLKADREQYVKDKAALVAVEPHNLTHIYALESITNNPEKRYFKIVMRSLLFLNVLNKKFLTRSFTVHEDSDFLRPIIKGGVITIFGLEALIETMGSIGAVYDPDAFPDNPHILGFMLDRPVTDKYIVVLRAALEAERASANQTFAPKFTYPGLEIIFQDIEATFTTLLRHYANHDDNKNLYVYDMAKDAADYFARIYEDFRLVEDGVKTHKSFSTKFPEQISRLKVRVGRVQRGSGMSIKQYARFGKLIADLEEKYEKDFKKEEQKSDH